jgi:hypothetical protein
MSESAPTAVEVAKWMMSQILEKGPLYQDNTAWDIKRKFGEKFVYDNQNGNPAIQKNVLDEFRKISGDDVVWSRSERHWRKREPSDVKGRMQD